jgi:hypothetical protein
MDVAANEIADATAQFLAEYWPRYVDQALEASGDEMDSVGDEDLRTAKATTDELIANPRAAVDTALFAEPERWPHRIPLDRLIEGMGRGNVTNAVEPWDAFEPREGNVGPVPALRNRVGVAAGTIAVPLRDAGLVAPGATMGDQPMLSFGVERTGRMLDSCHRYAQLAKEMQEALAELREARREDAGAEAKNRWDNA